MRPIDTNALVDALRRAGARFAFLHGSRAQGRARPGSDLDAGRVALHGELLFDDDPPARVEWQARTRLVYLDEEERQRRLDRIYHAGRRRGR